MGQGRILIVDDSTSDVELLLAAFQREHIINPIDTVYTAKAAIAYLAEANPLPVLVILDLVLPDILGLELLRAIRGDDRLKSVPVVVLSGLERPGDSDRALQLGANAFVAKSVDFANLQYSVAELKRRWLTE